METALDSFVLTRFPKSLFYQLVVYLYFELLYLYIKMFCLFLTLCTYFQQQYHSKIDVLIDEAFKEMISCLVSKVAFNFLPLKQTHFHNNEV